MRRAHLARDERGALSIEFLLVLGAFLVVFLVMLQLAVRAHADRVATAAAEDALAAASAYDGTVSAGESAGNRSLSGSTPNSTTPRSAVTRSSTTATATVKGAVPQLIPFLPVDVTVHLEGPVEQFVEEP